MVENPNAQFRPGGEPPYTPPLTVPPKQQLPSASWGTAVPTGAQINPLQGITAQGALQQAAAPVAQVPAGAPRAAVLGANMAAAPSLQPQRYIPGPMEAKNILGRVPQWKAQMVGGQQDPRLRVAASNAAMDAFRNMAGGV